MKRKFIFSIIFLLSFIAAAAQSGLHVNSLFGGKFQNRSDATEVTMKGRRISQYKLTLFRSLTISGNSPEAREVERLVKADAAHAADKESASRGARLYYGFYRLQPKGGLNRYLFYRNNALKPGAKPTLTLIYMEGKASIAELKRNFSK